MPQEVSSELKVDYVALQYRAVLEYVFVAYIHKTTHLIIF
jgi:hypothetical protein